MHSILHSIGGVFWLAGLTDEGQRVPFGYPAISWYSQSGTALFAYFHVHRYVSHWPCSSRLKFLVSGFRFSELELLIASFIAKLQGHLHSLFQVRRYQQSTFSAELCEFWTMKSPVTAKHVELVREWLRDSVGYGIHNLGRNCPHVSLVFSGELCRRGKKKVCTKFFTLAISFLTIQSWAVGTEETTWHYFQEYFSSKSRICMYVHNFHYIWSCLVLSCTCI